MARVYVWAWIWALFTLSSMRVAGRGRIKGEPRVTSPWEARKVVREGDNVRLLCPITATPDPLYEWFKDGDEVGATWNRYNPKKKMLKIRDVVLDDAGFFTCVGINGFGKINASMSLIVLRHGEPGGNLMEPQLTEVWPEGFQKRLQGEPLTLTCRARGLPTPTVTWYKDDLMLTRIGEQLTFSRLDISDSGRYTCRANSALGGTAANFTLLVGDAEKDSDLEISEAVNTTVMEGGTTSLQCTVRTSSIPTVQWLKEIPDWEPREGGAQIPNTTKQLGGRWYRKVLGAGGIVSRGNAHYLSKLTISDAIPKDTGVYVCLAVNDMGFSYRKAHLTVLRPSGKPHSPVGEKEPSINWFFLIIPGVAVVMIVGAVIFCQMRKTTPDKPIGVSPPTPVLKCDDASALTPLNHDTHPHSHPPTLPTPPDLVYQEVNAYTGGSVRGTRHLYPTNAYAESYVDPAYSNPYYAADGEHTRGSEHSYAILTHPSITSHASSSSTHLPPPYAHQMHTHTHAHTHRNPQYFVHYNL